MVISRFGFNGILRDDEVKDLGGYTVPPNEGVGNTYDFGARMYDPRVTRFFSLDPMKAAFPWQSPYLYAGNDPVLFIDEGGLFQKKFDKDKYKTLSKIIDQAKIYAQQINQKIIPALVKYGQVKDQFNDNYQDAKRKVIKDLTPNRGVSVIVQNLKGPFYGMYIQGDEFIINQSFVEQLERGNANEAEFQALATHLLFTLYHEYSHSQDRKSKKPFSGEDGAEGFEKATTGVVMGNHLGNTLRMIKEGKLIPVNVENPYPKENKPNDREKQDDNEEIPKEN